jgi:hypothetical protein
MAVGAREEPDAVEGHLEGDQLNAQNLGRIALVHRIPVDRNGRPTIQGSARSRGIFGRGMFFCDSEEGARARLQSAAQAAVTFSTVVLGIAQAEEERASVRSPGEGEAPAGLVV